MPSPIGRTSSQQLKNELVVTGAVPTEPPPSSSSSSGPQGNTVVTYSGPDSRPSAAPSDGLSAAAQTAVANARELLDTHVSRLDFIVTQREAKEALGGLSALSPDDFRLAVNELSSSGHLATMLDKLPWEDRCRFLELANEKGMVEMQPGERPAGSADPPPRPDLYRHDVKLPREVNDLIHEHSKAAVSQYKSEYEAYQDRFAELVSNAKTPAELRRLGSPDSGYTAWELTDYRDPLNNHYNGDWNANLVCGPSRIYKAISDRMAELTGERKDGSFWLEMKFEGHVGSAGGEVTLTTGKPATPLVEAHLVAHPVGGAKGAVKVKPNGAEGSLKGTPPGGPPLGGKAAVDGDGNLKDASFDVGPVGAAYSTSKGVGVRVTALKGELSAPGKPAVKGEVGSTSYVNPTTAELRGGVYGKVSAVDDLVEGKVDVSVGVKGLTPESASRALSHLTGNREGFMDVPEELEQGKSWSSLAPERKKFLEGLGWSEGEWTRRLASDSEP